MIYGRLRIGFGDDGASEINFGISDGSFAAGFKFEYKFASARLRQIYRSNLSRIFSRKFRSSHTRRRFKFYAAAPKLARQIRVKI